jgi:MoaA/NifB/PqqE/SkfB family radical SAM enzyme
MMDTFAYESIDEYQLEITTYCNAACPQCPRNDLGIGINPHMPLCHLDRTCIDHAFEPELSARLRQIFFCGSYGDPIMHPELPGIMQDFRSKNPKLWLYMHTNGGVHDQQYWRDLAGIIGGQGQIDFGIDGLDDTLSLYRRNVDFSKVVDNATAFIQAGGRAQWNFLVFEHNQHQVEQAQELSQRLGFAAFLPRRTGRFFHHGKVQELSEWPVSNKDGSVAYHLRPSTLTQYRNRSMLALGRLHQEYTDIRDYFDTTHIHCDAMAGHKVAINAEGTVLPCNFFNHNLYDRRFHDRDVLPGSHALSWHGDQNQVREFLNRYGLHNLNIHHRSLQEIFSNAMWQDLMTSWGQSLDQGRLFECAMTCGQKLTKVWDQGGNK